MNWQKGLGGLEKRKISFLDQIFSLFWIHSDEMVQNVKEGEREEEKGETGLLISIPQTERQARPSQRVEKR